MIRSFGPHASTGPGRPRKPAYQLLPPHPLHEHYVLRERAKFPVPVFVGDPPPRLPSSHDATNTRSRKAQHDRALYYGTLFLPWHASSPVDMSPAAWSAHMESLQQTAALDTNEPHVAVARDIARGRLFRIKQVANALVTDSRKAKLTNMWRCRNRTMWNAHGPGESSRKSGGSNADKDDAEVNKDISDLHKNMERTSDASSIQRAAAAERWVDDIELKLKAAQHVLEPTRTTAPWHSQAPAPSSNCTFPLHGEPKTLYDIVASLQQPRVPATTHNGKATQAKTGKLSAPSTESPDTVPHEFKDITEAAFQKAQQEYNNLRRNKTADDVLPPPPLNTEQRRFAREQFQAQSMLSRGRTSGEDVASTLQTLKRRGLAQVSLLQGAAGVGKTVLLRAQQTQLVNHGFGHMALTAWTGVAAAPFQAPTLCTLLGIEYLRLHQEPSKTEQQIGRIRSQYALYYGEPAELMVFVIDEVSFLDPAVLHWVDQLLRWLLDRPAVPFGGVLVQLAGDFWQKQPTAGTPLAELLVQADAPLRRAKELPPTSPMAKGLDIFRQAKRTVLTQQMRAADDPAFQKVLEHTRCTNAEQPVPWNFIRELKELSQADLAKNPSRAFAPIVVLSNHERHRLNVHQVQAFARAYNLPLIRWKLPLAGKGIAALSQGILDGLFENEVGLWQYFVRGAPCMLLTNIEPTKSLANGSMGFLHSLCFADGPPSQVHEAERRNSFAVVDLPSPPLSMNIMPILADDDDGCGIETLTPGAVVVPILASSHLLEFDTSSLYAVMNHVPRTLHHHGHPVALAFAITDFKVQGRTLDFLNMSLASRPFPPHLDLKGFYVMISRVRNADGIRVLSRDDDLRHLAKLRHARELAVWHASYSSSGLWDAGLARTNAQIAVKQKPAPKRQGHRSK